MTKTENKLAEGYTETYEFFNSPLMKKIRAESYEKDFGQHSWITFDELCVYIEWLHLSGKDSLLDLGCGPSGPLTFIVKKSKCIATGLDLSSEALSVGKKHVQNLNLGALIQFQKCDANKPLSFKNNTFDAVISIDVILHLQSREEVFREIARVLKPNGKFLFTDAGILIGPISNEEIKIRSINGYTQFVPMEFNEHILASTGFKLEGCEDVTKGVIKNARSRYTARIKYQSELTKSEGEENFNKQQGYLKTVVKLYRRKALSRNVYFSIRK